MRHVVAHGQASASVGHHTHSHHSSVMRTPDPALYAMHPYSYAPPQQHQQEPQQPQQHEVYCYDSLGALAYYDFGPWGPAGEESHGM